MVTERFSNVEDENIIGKFNKLRQIDIVKEHVKEFGELKSFMLASNPYLTGYYFVKSFVSGLRSEIGNMLLIMSSKSLRQYIFPSSKSILLVIITKYF